MRGCMHGHIPWLPVLVSVAAPLCRYVQEEKHIRKAAEAQSSMELVKSCCGQKESEAGKTVEARE